MRASTHVGERQRLRRDDRHLIEDERRGLGAVADDGVALAEQPLLDAGGGDGPVADRRARDAAA